MADIAKPEPLLPFDEKGRLSTTHGPKEPRRAPTREEFIATLNGFRDLKSDGDVILNNAMVEVDLIKVFDALAAERNEWKRRAEAADPHDPRTDAWLALSVKDRREVLEYIRTYTTYRMHIAADALEAIAVGGE